MLLVGFIACDDHLISANKLPQICAAAFHRRPTVQIEWQKASRGNPFPIVLARDMQVRAGACPPSQEG